MCNIINSSCSIESNVWPSNTIEGDRFDVDEFIVAHDIKRTDKL